MVCMDKTLTYEEYAEALANRHFAAFEVYQCDAIVNALVNIGFTKDEARFRTVIMIDRDLKVVVNKNITAVVG